ncbi:MAG: ATPase, T2SS/T4P/T4SS family, partial [Planctomycetia bacterium]
MWTFDKILRGARAHEASDVHLIQNLPPVVRIGGQIGSLQGEAIPAAALDALVRGLLTPVQIETFDRDWQLCFSRMHPGVGRYRASVYLNAGCPELSIRLCETAIRTRGELTLPERLDEVARLPNGLVLLVGPTGVGKTTTLSYLVNLINQERRAKIITIEDPIEYVHRHSKSIII